MNIKVPITISTPIALIEISHSSMTYDLPHVGGLIFSFKSYIHRNNELPEDNGQWEGRWLLDFSCMCERKLTRFKFPRKKLTQSCRLFETLIMCTSYFSLILLIRWMVYLKTTTFSPRSVHQDHTKLINWFSLATDQKNEADPIFFYILYIKIKLPTDSKSHLSFNFYIFIKPIFFESQDNYII